MVLFCFVFTFVFVLVKETELSFSGVNQPYMFRAFYRQMQVCNVQTFEQFKSSNVPICMIHGKDDKLTPIDSAKAFFDDFSKDNDKTVVALSKFHEIKDTSHQVMQENPKTVNQHIKEFVVSVMDRK